jgi:hypothetical protein
MDLAVERFGKDYPKLGLFPNAEIIHHTPERDQETNAFAKLSQTENETERERDSELEHRTVVLRATKNEKRTLPLPIFPGVHLGRFDG